MLALRIVCWLLLREATQEKSHETPIRGATARSIVLDAVLLEFGGPNCTLLQAASHSPAVQLRPQNRRPAHLIDDHRRVTRECGIRDDEFHPD